MKIPTTLALKIVKDMKNIINQDLNFINTDGYIIASTNKKRIGTFHEASLKCIATKNEIIINNDNEYLGSKKGINIPVYLDNEIVGIIGITGERKDVEKYGKIIKSMTEILIKEAQIKELTIKKREKNRSIIETILFNYNKNLDFYISLTFPYTVIVGKTNDKTIPILDNNLKHFAERIRKDLKIDVENVAGAGAAGGLGAGLMAFLSAELRRGIDIVIEYSKLEEKLKGATLVITGEGSIDGQTRFGKTPYGVAQAAKKQGIPVIALAGNVGEDIDILYNYGFNSIFSILPGIQNLETALKNGEKNLERVSENIGRTILAFK